MVEPPQTQEIKAEARETVSRRVRACRSDASAQDGPAALFAAARNLAVRKRGASEESARIGKALGALLPLAQRRKSKGAPPPRRPGGESWLAASTTPPWALGCRAPILPTASTYFDTPHCTT